MSERLVRLAKIEKVSQRKQVPVVTLSQEERVALHTLRVESRDHGITLADRIHQFLSPSIVLHVMRRDRFQCCVHKDLCTGPMHVVSKYPARFVWHHRNEPANLITVCQAATEQAQHQKEGTP